MNLRAEAEKLSQGRVTKFIAYGNSMSPRVKSGTLVRVVPVGVTDPVVGDVVLCKVSGRYYLHLVTAVEGGPKPRWQISNAKGKVNGWTTRERIYGVVL